MTTETTNKLMALAYEFAMVWGPDEADKPAEEALRTAIEQALSARVPDGYALVPAEPSIEMLAAAINECGLSGQRVYRVMLAAAPQPASEQNSDAKDAARSENEALRREIQNQYRCIESHAKVTQEAEADAERYRWLREQNADLGAGFYVGDDTGKLEGDISWVGSDLDAAIDAAMKEGGAA